MGVLQPVGAEMFWWDFGSFWSRCGCFDEHSGVVFAFFVVGLECFDERSGGILALFGAGMGLMSYQKVFW